MVRRRGYNGQTKLQQQQGSYSSQGGGGSASSTGGWDSADGGSSGAGSTLSNSSGRSSAGRRRGGRRVRARQEANNQDQQGRGDAAAQDFQHQQGTAYQQAVTSSAGNRQALNGQLSHQFGMQQADTLARMPESLGAQRRIQYGDDYGDMSSASQASKYASALMGINRAEPRRAGPPVPNEWQQTTQQYTKPENSYAERLLLPQELLETRTGGGGSGGGGKSPWSAAVMGSRDPLPASAGAGADAAAQSAKADFYRSPSDQIPSSVLQQHLQRHPAPAPAQGPLPPQQQQQQQQRRADPWTSQWLGNSYSAVGSGTF